MRKKWKLVFIIPAAIVGITLFILIGGELVMHLWNWLLPPLFGWRLITFWQGLGVLLLCRILFGGHGWHGGHRSKFRRMRDRMDDHCGRMSPEEREKFRQAMRERWGFGPSTSESTGH
ncbi:MAG: hypothetical protein ACLQLC_21450 [Candidatus Sulfotelmatobacter sp.]